MSWELVLGSTAASGICVPAGTADCLLHTAVHHFPGSEKIGSHGLAGGFVAGAKLTVNGFHPKTAALPSTGDARSKDVLQAEGVTEAALDNHRGPVSGCPLLTFLLRDQQGPGQEPSATFHSIRENKGDARPYLP